MPLIEFQSHQRVCQLLAYIILTLNPTPGVTTGRNRFVKLELFSPIGSESTDKGGGLQKSVS